MYATVTAYGFTGKVGLSELLWVEPWKYLVIKTNGRLTLRVKLKPEDHVDEQEAPFSTRGS